MNSILAPNELLKDAQFSIEWRTKKIIEAKIRAEFTGEDSDKRELARHMKELGISQNYFNTLCEKFGYNPETQSDAVKALLD